MKPKTRLPTSLILENWKTRVLVKGFEDGKDTTPILDAVAFLSKHGRKPDRFDLSTDVMTRLIEGKNPSLKVVPGKGSNRELRIMGYQLVENEAVPEGCFWLLAKD